MKAPRCEFNEIVGKIQVLSMEVRTPLEPAAVEERLKAFFGEGGLGLELTEEGPGQWIFRRDGGHVAASFCPVGGKTLLRIVTSGWAVPVKKFVDGLP